MIKSARPLNQTIALIVEKNTPSNARTRINKAQRLAIPLVVGATLFPVNGSYGGELLQKGETTIRWDNTFKYSAAFRLSDPEYALIVNPNGDNGNRSFHPGLISNRLDLLSEVDVSMGRWRAVASAAAWYDSVYLHAPAPDTWTPPSLYTAPQRFAPEVRRLHGRHIELLDAFVSGTALLGDMPASVRIGRHSLVWGESLFFAGNGVAAGQNPIDTIKALGVPLSRAQEVFMPVTQVSLSVQPRPNLAVSAYYQFEWRKSRFPGAGSYFSAADFLDAGGYRLYVGRDQYLGRDRDIAAHDSGQFGVALRFTNNDADYGLYALRFHAKEPQLYIRPVSTAAPTAATRERPAAYGVAPGVYGSPSAPLQDRVPFNFGTSTGVVGSYALVYPRGIEIYGASYSGYLGDDNVAAELSIRRRMPLASIPLVTLPGMPADGDTHAHFARGNTLHAQASAATVLPPGGMWDSAALSGEIAINHRLHIAGNADVFDRSRTRFAASARILFEPTFFAVAPGLDLSLPFGFGYDLVGRSSVDLGQNAGAGSLELGLSATYRAVWRASIALTRFIGAPDKQALSDRHFIALSVQTTF